MDSLCATDVNLDPTNSESEPRRTLLIVDDEEGPRQALRIIFQDEYEVLLAEDGYKAVELASQIPIDAALLDIRMAGLSGIEVLHQLKQIDRATEVIMLTAYETAETARQALRLGACDYLDKPFDISTIRSAVRTAMDRRAVSQRIEAHNHKLIELHAEIHNQRLREEITRTRGEIYASILHDINGPLSIISGFVDVLSVHINDLRQLEGANLEFVKDRLARISGQVRNCIEISRRYLGFLRGQAGTITPISTNQILTDLSDLLRTHPSSKTNTLQIRTLRQDAGVRINGTDLIQILLNLAVNAFQSSPEPHTVKISAQQINRPLDSLALASGPYDLFLNPGAIRNRVSLIGLTIEDDGPGIPAEILPKIFDPYFSTKPQGQGTGLGLPIVRRLVEQVNGAIHVHSGPDGGAKFVIYLPSREESTVSAPE